MNDFEPIQRAWTIYQLCQVENYLRDHGFKEHAENVLRAGDKLLELFIAEYGRERFDAAMLEVDAAIHKPEDLTPETRH